MAREITETRGCNRFEADLKSRVNHVPTMLFLRELIIKSYSPVHRNHILIHSPKGAETNTASSILNTPQVTSLSLSLSLYVTFFKQG